MSDATIELFVFPASDSPSSDEPLTDILRGGARQLTVQAVEAEIAQWINERAHLTDERGPGLRAHGSGPADDERGRPSEPFAQ